MAPITKAELMAEIQTNLLFLKGSIASMGSLLQPLRRMGHLQSMTFDADLYRVAAAAGGSLWHMNFDILSGQCSDRLANVFHVTGAALTTGAFARVAGEALVHGGVSLLSYGLTVGHRVMAIGAEIASTYNFLMTDPDRSANQNPLAGLLVAAQAGLVAHLCF